MICNQIPWHKCGVVECDDLIKIHRKKEPWKENNKMKLKKEQAKKLKAIKVPTPSFGSTRTFSVLSRSQKSKTNKIKRKNAIDFHFYPRDFRKQTNA